MKYGRKIGALLLALVLALSLCATAFADEPASYGEVVLISGTNSSLNTVEGSGTNSVTVTFKNVEVTGKASGGTTYYTVGAAVYLPEGYTGGGKCGSDAMEVDGAWQGETDENGVKYWGVFKSATAEQIAAATDGKLEYSWTFTWSDSVTQTVKIVVDLSEHGIVVKDPSGAQLYPNVTDAAYTITIDKSVPGETYRAYKIFDVTYPETEEGTNPTAFSYTISTSSPWFETVAKYAVTDYTAGQAVYSGNGLTLTQSAADPTVYVVSGSSKDAEGTVTELSGPTFAEALAAANVTAEPAATIMGIGGSVTVGVNEPGYYFVDTTLGALCSLDTTTPDVTLYEKNSVPSITKQVFEDDTQNYGESAILDVIDAVQYKLTVNTGDGYLQDAVQLGTGVDGDYKIVDTLPVGFTYQNDAAVTGWATDEYKAEWNETDRTLTITLYAAKLKTLDPNTDIFITYTAKMTPDAVDYTSNPGNINNVTLTYKSQVARADASVYTYKIGGTTEDGQPIIQKVDGTEGANKKPLAGVKFLLSKVENGVTKYADVTQKVTGEDGAYYLNSWLDVLPATGNIITGAVTGTGTAEDPYKGGGIEVWGLDAGTYTLTEVETLPGYNLLDDTITIEIDAFGNVTYKMTSAEGAGSTNPIVIENKTGTELPSTGGAGTTLFYVIGGVLVLGAAVLLVTKRRMNGAK